MSSPSAEPLLSSDINHVADTAFWVAHYRAKESERPDALFRDPFARALGGERGARIAGAMPRISRYTEWSVVARSVIIDRFIERLVREGVDGVINLGAGLDARPYRLALPSQLCWVEVDHPAVIAHKTRVLENAKPNCKLTRVAADLSNEQERRALLKSVLPQQKRVLVLTEGVLPYLSIDEVRALGVELRQQNHIAYWLTEYFHPKVYPFLKNTVRAAHMQKAPFRFYPEDWFGFFRSTGWVEPETSFMDDVAIEFKRKPPMPRWAELLLALMPKQAREASMRRTGFSILQRG